jgi:CheY-like chemotaxis protein
MLDSEGYQVKASYDGHEGVETCRRFRPDIVFCDIGLPGMNGFEVAKIIKGDDDLKNTYLAALTGYAGESDLKRTKESGFDRHISKPANFDKIRHLIEEYREAIKA